MNIWPNTIADEVVNIQDFMDTLTMVSGRPRWPFNMLHIDVINF